MKWLGQSREKLLRRLVFSASARCDCGAGLAYDPHDEAPLWDCSAILLGDAMLQAGERGTIGHTTPRPFDEIVSERDDTAAGATTRP